MFGRPWQYDENKQQYYVIYEDKAARKKEDALRHIDETDLGDFWLRHIEPIYVHAHQFNKNYFARNNMLLLIE